MLIMMLGILVLRLLDLHAPPVLAVGMLPMVMPHPGYMFGASVFIGTTLFIVSFLLWRAVMTRARSLNGDSARAQRVRTRA